MTKKIITPGTNTFHAMCSDCGAQFSYEREDVHRNYVRGGEWVDCPHCGRPVYHLGACDLGARSHRRWTMSSARCQN
jgi:hypothetical protein